MREIKIPKNYKYIGCFLTMRCNLKCSYCLNVFCSEHFNREEFQEITGDVWLLGLNRIVSRPEVPVSFCGGEPFLHRDFIYIINNLREDLSIDILTNLQWGKQGIERFIREVRPDRINRKSPYPSIRVSYHPEQMGDGEKLIQNAKRLQDAGFRIGIYAIQYPSPAQLQAITQMQFRCANEGLLFRVKDFTGKFEGIDDNGNLFSILYGDYSKYPGAVFNKETRKCLCRTSEFLLGPNGAVYRCHRDLYAEENPIGNLLDDNFQITNQFRPCSFYGNCHPCDVKVKTDYKQHWGHTSVEIKEVF